MNVPDTKVKSSCRLVVPAHDLQTYKSFFLFKTVFSYRTGLPEAGGRKHPVSRSDIRMGGRSKSLLPPSISSFMICSTKRSIISSLNVSDEMTLLFYSHFLMETLIKCFLCENHRYNVPWAQSDCNFLYIPAERAKEVLIKSVFP